MVFGVVFGLIWYNAFYKDVDYLLPLPLDAAAAELIVVGNWWRGIYACVLFLCGYAYLKPDALDFFHPIQRFWRIISMLTLIYFCWILVMLNHRPKYGRWLLGYFDNSLNQDLTKGHHTYDDNCDLDLANIWDNFDHYYVVHLVNWFCASFVIRDFPILHFWHVLNEFQELSWEHILPHFRECWWDHILMDICLSNIPAITFGLWVQRKYGLVQYDFLGRAGTNSWRDWGVWHCHRKFGIISYTFILLYIFFLNGFFLNNNLLIPPLHPFPIMRLLLWFGFGSIAYREAYEDSRTWGTKEREHYLVQGRYRFLATAILLTESILCWKYREGTGHINSEAAYNTPWWNWGPWAASIVFIIVNWLRLRFKEGATTKYPQKKIKSKSA